MAKIKILTEILSKNIVSNTYVMASLLMHKFTLLHKVKLS